MEEQSEFFLEYYNGIKTFANMTSRRRISFDEWIVGYELFKSLIIYDVDNRILEYLVNILINCRLLRNTIPDAILFRNKCLELQEYLLKNLEPVKNIRV